MVARVSITNSGDSDIELLQMPERLWAHQLTFRLHDVQGTEVHCSRRLPAPLLPRLLEHEDLPPGDAAVQVLDLGEQLGLRPDTVGTYYLISALTLGKRTYQSNKVQIVFRSLDEEELLGAREYRVEHKGQGVEWEEKLRVGIALEKGHASLVFALYSEDGRIETARRIRNLPPDTLFSSELDSDGCLHILVEPFRRYYVFSTDSGTVSEIPHALVSVVEGICRIKPGPGVPRIVSEAEEPRAQVKPKLEEIAQRTSVPAQVRPAAGGPTWQRMVVVASVSAALAAVASGVVVWLLMRRKRRAA